LTDVAPTVTVEARATEVGGWYVAPVLVTFVRVPHDDAEQTGFPHVTPEESFAPPLVTAAVNDKV
jgi:hypothetical protein